MFRIILAEDVRDMAKRYREKNPYVFFKPALEANSKAYKALIKSKAFKALDISSNGSFQVNQGDSNRLLMYLKSDNSPERQEVRYNYTVASELERIHKTHCKENKESLCQEIGSMLETFKEFESDDWHRYNVSIMNNGDWHTNASVPTRYELTPATERPRWKP